MSSITTFASLADWIAREAISFSLESAESLNGAVDRLVAGLGDSVDLLGLGEPTHLVEGFLRFRNRVFQRLVEAHGFTAIALESSFPRGRVVNEYVLGQQAAIEDVLESGTSHGFGRMAGNRALVEWMRAHNADARHAAKLHFYGFDSPTEMMYADSPRRMLEFVLEYLAAVDVECVQTHRERIATLVGEDFAWENQAAAMDPTKSIGGAANANELRVTTEDLIAALLVGRPEFVAKSDALRFQEAMHYAKAVRQLLAYHAVMARSSEKRLVELLGLRDAMMAENLAYIVSQRGRVLAFAHNSHLQRGRAEWQWGPNSLAWWPAGAHVNAMLGTRYAVIGTGVGVSTAIGIGEPEAGTLETLTMSAPGPARFVPTHRGDGLPKSAVDSLPTRTGTASYFPLTPQSVTDFDWLAVLDGVD